MKTLACRTILHLGYQAETSYDLMLAAELQAKHKLDITWDLLPLLDKSERQRKYSPPQKVMSQADISDASMWHRTDEDTSTSQVYFSIDGNRVSESDAGGCDDKHYYMWRHNRVIEKGVIRDDGNWDCLTGSEVENYSDVTFIYVDG